MWQELLTFIQLILIFGAIGYSISLVVTTSLIALVQELKQDKPKWRDVAMNLGLLITMALYSTWTFQAWI